MNTEQTDVNLLVVRAFDRVKTHRHQKLSRMLKTPKAKLQGTWNHYGLFGNHRRMQLDCRKQPRGQTQR